MLAEDDDEMVSFLKNHLIDVQNTGPNKMPWKFEGPWNINGKAFVPLTVKLKFFFLQIIQWICCLQFKCHAM